MNDFLADSTPRHWTGIDHSLRSLVRIDGSPYRLMGREPRRAQLMVQRSVDVNPTQTIYTFEAAGVEIVLRFTTPFLPEDLDLFARPVTYISWSARATDGQPHHVQAFFSASADLVVHETSQQVTWSRPTIPGLNVMRLGTTEQRILQRASDDARIEWGYLYLAIPKSDGLTTAILSDNRSWGAFGNRRGDGTLPDADDSGKPRAASDDTPVLAASIDMGQVADEPVTRHAILALDDLYSVDYFGEKLRPYWRRDGMTAGELLERSAAEVASIVQRCEEFDRELMADLEEIGGPRYADLCALSYRQSIAAHKLVAAPQSGEPWLFSKECFSNGCMATVDVMYPTSPIFMLVSNELLKASLRPVLDYAAMDRWPWPFAPHDLGRYPIADGQIYGGGEKSLDRQMPVEESGNMLLLMAAACKIDGDAKFAESYWPLLSQWAGYLKEKGLDPENQLCTDDFAGHLAHNTNLSLKAIEALGAYAEMCRMTGRVDEADSYRKLAEKFADQWQQMADDGDHYRLAFDKPGTWSQKYNLVWDELLALHLFPKEVIRKELDFYERKLNAYGLPLDNREDYTKLDWEVWTASLAESDEQFQTLMAPVYAFVNNSPDRVPLTDWYWTSDGRRRGFQARSVVGGVFIKALTNKEIWSKWSGRR